MVKHVPNTNTIQYGLCYVSLCLVRFNMSLYQMSEVNIWSEFWIEEKYPELITFNICCSTSIWTEHYVYINTTTIHIVTTKKTLYTFYWYHFLENPVYKQKIADVTTKSTFLSQKLTKIRFTCTLNTLLFILIHFKYDKVS